MQPSRIALLQNMPIFGAIRDDALDFLLGEAVPIEVADGQYFFRQGDEATCMYVLEAGRVAVIKSWQGRECLLHHLGEGDCFGEMALLDMHPRSASVRAECHCRAIELETEALLRLSERDMEQFALIQMNIGREVCRRLRASDEMLFRARMGEPVARDGRPGRND